MGSSHKKQGKIADNNAKKAKLFGKIVKLIQVEAKRCSGDETDPALRTVVEKARKANVPKETIERAIKKASEVGDLSSMLYEGYGPAGVGLIITALTENTNRTSPEIKHLLSKNGASLGAPGSVAWNFTKNPETGDWEPNTTVDLSSEDQDALSELIELLEDHDDVQDVYTSAK
ncbi:YebC/PmpR family DNA-binding transcriptional regulator [Candidatus Nomurabacteria bacterium]|nr:YebC/PmpR family DNA-binding transcriptional regulator [Candidatus Nomurabacteria bacterium]